MNWVGPVTLALACHVLLAGPSSVGVQAQTQGTAERKKVEKKLSNEKQSLTSSRQKQTVLEKDLKQLDAERAKLNRQLIDMVSRVQHGEDKLTELEGRLGELDAQRRLISGSLVRQHRSLGQLLSSLQRMGRNPPPVLVTPRGDSLDMVRSAMLLASVFPELKEKAVALARELDDLDSVATQIRDQGEQLRTENERLAIAQRRLDAIISTKQNSEARALSELADIKRIAESHAKSVNNLNELIAKLDEAVSKKAGLGKYEKQLAAEKAKRRTSGKTVKLSPSRTRLATLSPARLQPEIAFADMKGKLRRPVRGRRMMAFGDKTRYGNRSKGIAFEARAKGRVVSPSDGWIVYADRFRTYGQLLIINAGGGYHILLAGMARIDVSIGQFVLSGEPVGVMGASSKAKKSSRKEISPVLYIEFRYKGRPINPDSWWAGQSRKVQG